VAYLECVLMEKGIDCASLRGPFLPDKNYQSFPKDLGDEITFRWRPLQGIVVLDKDFFRHLRVTRHKARDIPPPIEKTLLVCKRTRRYKIRGVTVCRFQCTCGILLNLSLHWHQKWRIRWQPLLHAPCKLLHLSFFVCKA